MRLNTPKNPIITCIGEENDELIYKINESDLQWLLNCTRAVLQGDVKNVENAEIVNHIHDNIKRIEDAFEVIDVSNQDF